MTEFNETMEDVMNSVKEVSVGDIVQGEVLAIDDNKQAIVSILGTGVEGVIPMKELSSLPVEDINDAVKVGDVLDLVVITSIGKDKENGSYLLSKRRLEAKKIWEEIEADYQAGKEIEAPVIDIVKGGLVVDAGVRGFVPASMVSDHFISDFSNYKGQTLKFKIIEIEPSENRLILSHKAVLQEEKAEAIQKLMAKLEEGATVEGKVARLTNFGAFVDLGGVDGLVHVSEIAHEHVAQPSDKLEVGQDVKVKILSIDPEANRISLSIKALEPAPWDLVADSVKVGDVFEGTVKRLTSFGAFVEIFPGVEGLVHISQIAHKHIATPHEVLKEGETVKVKVLDVQPEEHRIGLSIKALEPKQETADESVEEDSYELPEESTGFTLEEQIGDQLTADSEE